MSLLSTPRRPPTSMIRKRAIVLVLSLLVRECDVSEPKPAQMRRFPAKCAASYSGCVLTSRLPRRRPANPSDCMDESASDTTAARCRMWPQRLSVHPKHLMVLLFASSIWTASKNTQSKRKKEAAALTASVHIRKFTSLEHFLACGSARLHPGARIDSSLCKFSFPF